MCSERDILHDRNKLLILELECWWCASCSKRTSCNSIHNLVRLRKPVPAVKIEVIATGRCLVVSSTGIAETEIDALNWPLERAQQLLTIGDRRHARNMAP